MHANIKTIHPHRINPHVVDIVIKEEGPAAGRASGAAQIKILEDAAAIGVSVAAVRQVKGMVAAGFPQDGQALVTRRPGRRVIGDGAGLGGGAVVVDPLPAAAAHIKRAAAA